LNKDLADKNHALSRSENQLRETNATKDRFFSIIAHDLKNPLGSFRDMTKMMIEDHDSFSSDERMEFLRMMNHSAIQLYELLENLLNWSRSQTDRMEFNPVEADIIKLIEGNVNLLHNNAFAKNISLVSKTEGSLMTMFDVNMITTVIRNLLSNAIKFTPEGGRINVGAVRENGSIKVFVEDNGVGIPEEHIEKIFRIDEFYSTTGTSDEKGTGLGLILCKEFVEKNGGDINVESKVGDGTTFYFRIPVKRAIG
jgi:signal transduction histidine kinase